MTMVVENGTGLLAANAYVSVAAAVTYATDRGLPFADSPAAESEQAIVRATASLDSMYRSRYPGYRTHGREQGLEWPRTAAYDAEGNLIPSDHIPVEIKNSTCELAVRELSTPGSTNPDLARGGEITSLQAGSVGITYAANAQVGTEFQTVEGIMAGLLGTPFANFVGTAERI